MTEHGASTDDKAQVTFSSDGIRLAGDIRVPRGRGPHPAIALTGPFTGVRQQVTGTYARLLADAGFLTLAFDHRGCGGRPQHGDPQGKLADLRAAVSQLAGRDDVAPGRIAVVGVCLGGGYAGSTSAPRGRRRSAGWRPPAHRPV